MKFGDLGEISMQIPNYPSQFAVIATLDYEPLSNLKQQNVDSHNKNTAVIVSQEHLES